MILKYNDLPVEIKSNLKEIENLLVTQDSELLKSYMVGDGFSVDLTSLKSIAGAWGENIKPTSRITPRPEETLSDVYVVRATDPNPETIFIDYVLWIDGKRSDLTLKITFTKSSENTWKALIEDLHVE